MDEYRIELKNCAYERANELIEEYNNMDYDTLYDKLVDSIDFEVRTDLDGRYRSVKVWIGSDLSIDTKTKVLTYKYSDFKESRGLTDDPVNMVDFIVKEWTCLK